MNKTRDSTVAGEINQCTSIYEEEIYFNFMHFDNYNLLDISKPPKTKSSCIVTEIIIKHLSAANNETIYFSKRKISGIFILRKCK